MSFTMKLPQYVSYCLKVLEDAGYEAFAVGGCVRDSLLGIPPHDYDVCTNAPAEQVAQMFPGFTKVTQGMRHGTVGVVIGKNCVEITTYRTEGGYTDHRHPGWVKAADDIREDLARRDFTVNAMAYSPAWGLVDPFGGQGDLENRILRAVGDPELRFTEDALRILRGVRFAVRFGLRPEEKTLDAMVKHRELLGGISRERIFHELDETLPRIGFEDLMRYALIFGAAIPELGATIGFQQHSPHHAYDIYTHSAYVTAALPEDGPLRWGALLHDIGKVSTLVMDDQGVGHYLGHAIRGSNIAKKIMEDFGAPGELRDEVYTLVNQHSTLMFPDEFVLVRRLRFLGEKQFRRLVLLQIADFENKGPRNEVALENLCATRDDMDRLIRDATCLHVRDLALTGRDLVEMDIPSGKVMGALLNRLVVEVMDKKLENTPEALKKRAAYLYQYQRSSLT